MTGKNILYIFTDRIIGYHTYQAIRIHKGIDLKTQPNKAWMSSLYSSIYMEEEKCMYARSIKKHIHKTENFINFMKM